MRVVRLNGFDLEEGPHGGLQLTSIPVSKNTTFGVCTCSMHGSTAVQARCILQACLDDSGMAPGAQRAAGPAACD